MALSSLRVYYGPENDVVSTVEPQTSNTSVTVPLAEILPMLADAVNNHRTWLSDFADDEVTVSNDLYEIILAYQHFTRPSA